MKLFEKSPFAAILQRELLRLCHAGSLASLFSAICCMSNHIEQFTCPVQRLAALNDLARTAMRVASRLHQATSICPLLTADHSAIREAVEKFNLFNPSNDPYGECDFGGFEYDGQKIYWKIDYYYDKKLKLGSEHPEDPSQTTRVLTIMLAEEY